MERNGNGGMRPNEGELSEKVDGTFGRLTLVNAATYQGWGGEQSEGAGHDLPQEMV